MAGLFDGKKGLITGVFNKQSIAWAIADRVMAEGGDCGFTHMPDKPDDERKKNEGRVRKLIDGNPRAKFLVPMDVTVDEHVDAVAARCASEFGKIDFLLHSIAFAPPEDLKKDTVDTSREGFKHAMAISVHMFQAPVLREETPRSKNGRPSQTTTGAVSANCSQRCASAPIQSRKGRPRCAPISNVKTPSASGAARRRRLRKSVSSGFSPASSDGAAGSSAMPQIGQSAG